MGKTQIKALIEISNSFLGVDEVLVKYTPCRTTQEKINYLSELFDVKIIDGTTGNIDDDYRMIVEAIISKKWR